MSNYYTLRFPDYATAKAAAQQLGFWNHDDDCLITDGQSRDPETGEVFGWSIVECGQDPPGGSGGYYVNAVGRLPEPALSFLAPEPYGVVGPVFAGSL